MTARARREIILCGGAINSPQLLLLSGIGPKRSSREFGIPVVQHLPGVGQSLQDHYSAAIKLKCRLPVTVNDVMLSNAKKLKAGLDYYLFRTRAAGDDQFAGGIVRAHPAGTGLARRQMLDLAVQRRAAAGRAAQMVGVHDDRLSAAPGQPRRDQAEERRPGRPAGDAPQLPDRRDRPARPSSPGSSCAAGSSPSRSWQRFVASEFLPGPEVQSDAELLDYARRRGGTVYHPTSTCKMGVDADGGGRSRIAGARGSRGLRVADASVMPTVVSGNTNAATIMIGERPPTWCAKRSASPLSWAPALPTRRG